MHGYDSGCCGTVLSACHLLTGAYGLVVTVRCAFLCECTNTYIILSFLLLFLSFRFVTVQHHDDWASSALVLPGDYLLRWIEAGETSQYKPGRRFSTGWGKQARGRGGRTYTYRRDPWQDGNYRGKLLQGWAWKPVGP